MRAGNVTRQAGTKTRPFVFLNETGGEKTARETFLLCPRLGMDQKYRDLYSLTPVKTHACIYIKLQIYVGTYTTLKQTCLLTLHSVQIYTQSPTYIYSSSHGG